MPIDPLHLTLMALANKNAALDRATTELKNSLNGNIDHDAPIQAQLASMHAEQVQIASRLAAISSGGAFTPPQTSDVNALGDAINALDRDIKASAVLNTILADTADVMQQFGAAASRGKPA